MFPYLARLDSPNPKPHMNAQIRYLYHLLLHAEKETSGFAYLGNFDDKITEHIIELNRSSGAQEVLLDKKLSKRMSFLLVESYQNLVRHTEETNFGDSFGRGMFRFRTFPEGYDIDSLNVVDEETGLSVEKNINYLNSLGEEELDKTYRTKLEESSQTEGKGAGLGLIEIARKSGRKVWCKSHPAPNGEVVLHQYVYFRTDGTLLPNLSSHSLSSVDLLNKMRELGILLQFTGSFIRDAIHPLFNILRENIIAVHQKELKRVGTVMLELLQNIAKHGEEVDGVRTGVFTISRTPLQNEYVLSSGNWIEASKITELNNRLHALKSFNMSDLGSAYREKVKDGIESGDTVNSGLGLMEIAKFSKSEWSWEIISDENKPLAFFGISVVLN